MPSGKLPVTGVFSRKCFWRNKEENEQRANANRWEMSKNPRKNIFLIPSSFQVERIVLPCLKRCTFRASIHFLNPFAALVQRTETKHSVLSPSCGNEDTSVEVGPPETDAANKWHRTADWEEELQWFDLTQGHNKIVITVLCVASTVGHASRPVF